MQEELQDIMLILSGEEQSVQVPVFDMGSYLIRPWNTDDFGQIASLTDPSLAEQLDTVKLNELTEVGYSFEDGKHGAVGFVAQDKEKNEIVARAYVKTWHGNDFTKPKYRETNAGIEVITAKELMGDANKIVELGGWLVSSEHQGKKLAQALTYASIDFIKRMQDTGYEADTAFITNLGPLRVQDNANRTDYGLRMADKIRENGYDPSDLTALAKEKDDDEKHPVVITTKQFREVFDDLSTTLLVDGRKRKSRYEFGDPRSDTSPAYHISGKLIAEQPLITYTDEKGKRLGLISPIKFEQTRAMHTEHGGNYTIVDLR